MTPDTINQKLQNLPGWTSDGRRITREFRFPDFDATMAFVNAVADIAREDDHHPDLEVSYSRVKVAYTTHSAGGLSDKDFTAAARVQQLAGQ